MTRRRPALPPRARLRQRTTTRHAVSAPSSSAAAVLTLLLVGNAACGGKGPLGPPDSYLVYEPVVSAGAASTAVPPGGAAPAPRPLRALALEDARAVPIHRGSMDGFIGEILRTDYLAKQLVREGWDGRAFSAPARARAAEPTVLVVAGSRVSRAEDAEIGVGLSAPGGFLGRAQSHPEILWVELGDDPGSDPAFVQTASGRIARLVGERLTDAAATPGAARAPALVSGYAWAMEVIGREWRVGEGPRGTIPPDAGTATQRERFAAVRQNSAVLAEDDPHSLRPGGEMLTAPGVIATLIYRMAQSRMVGHRVGPQEIYAPFVQGRIPQGVSPAAVL